MGKLRLWKRQGLFSFSTSRIEIPLLLWLQSLPWLPSTLRTNPHTPCVPPGHAQLLQFCIRVQPQPMVLCPPQLLSCSSKTNLSLPQGLRMCRASAPSPSLKVTILEIMDDHGESYLGVRIRTQGHLRLFQSALHSELLWSLSWNLLCSPDRLV